MTQPIPLFFARPAGLVLMACIALLSSSCSLSQRNTGMQSEPAQPTPAQHLAQMNFGRQAEFSLCTPPACPAVTPKTLALLPRATLPETPPSATAPFLDDGEASVPELPRTTTVTPAPLQTAAKTVLVHFHFAEASLSPKGEAILESALAAVPDAKPIFISGRTDNMGTANANEAPAAARARAVHDYLSTRHPHLTPILKLDAQGTCCYVAPNDTAQGRSLNRRVEVHLSRDGGARP